MSTLSDFVFPLILRTSLVMLVTMALFRGLIWLLDLRSPHVHRWASLIVLAQGWIVAPLVIAIPWYEPEPVTTTSVRPVSTPPTSLIPELPETTWTAADLPSTTPEPAAASAPSHQIPTISLPPIFQSLWSLTAIVWLVGIIALVVCALANYYRYCRAACSVQSPDDETSAQWQSLLQRTHCPAPLPLRLTSNLGPMLCLLPRGYEVWVPVSYWLACSADEQEAILRHELSQYGRGDIWKNWLVYLLALPQWFNPAAWWGVWNFQQAGEWLCDLDVARSSSKSDYLRAILRLVELQTPTLSVAGQCAHAHPLLVRVRRLLSPRPSQDSRMKTLLFAAAALLAVAVSLVRIELVAQAADPPASLLAVKDRMAEFDSQLEQVKDGLNDLHLRAETIKPIAETKVGQLNQLAEDPDSLSAELREKAERFLAGNEKTQLELIKTIDKLANKDEQILALGRAIKESPHESVRQQGLSMVIAKGEEGYPAIAISFESLSTKDRAYLAKELHRKTTSNDKILLYSLMAKNANDELLGTLLDLDLPIKQRLLFLASIAEDKKDNDQFAAKVLEIADNEAGDDGLLLLYAVAKAASPKNAASAVKLALKRKQDAWPVIAAAYKKEDSDCRAAVVKAAKELGGESADFLIKHALEDQNAELKAAAEAALK
jgi:beta-lactamase regulating signal transducer with metallopeptidase domain